MADAIYVKVDTSGLTKMLALAQQFTKRTPAIAANTAMFFVMRGTVRDTARVSVAQIDTELAVISVFGKTAKGNPSVAKKNMLKVGGFSSIQRKMSLPLSLLIVRARMNPNSNYNATTGNRYAITNSPLKGLRGSARILAMDMIASRMIKARHSSIAFIASSILPVIRGLEPFVAPKYRRGAPPLDSQARIAYDTHSETDKGAVTPAQEGAVTVFCYAELLIGMVGKNSKSQNEALHRVIGPVLQDNVNIEAEKQFRYAAEQEYKQLENDCRSIGACR